MGDLKHDAGTVAAAKVDNRDVLAGGHFGEPGAVGFRPDVALRQGGVPDSGG